MNPKEGRSPLDPPLRTAAETQWETEAKSEIPMRSAEALQQELQAHQVELEMENEALRHAQVALAESRDRYVDLYEFAPVGYFTLDAEGLIEEVNHTGVSLLEVERQALLQKPFVSLIDAEDQSRWEQHVLSMVRSGKPGNVTLSFRRGEETVFQARLDCRSVPGDSAPTTGRPLRLRIAMSDATEQVQADRVVRNERKRAMTVLDVAGDPIFVKDNEHRIILANRAFCELFGLDESEVIGKTLAEDVPVDQRIHFLAVDRHVLDTGNPDVREESLTVNGMARTIVTRKTRLVERSGERFLVGVIFDITERTQAAQKNVLLEAQLRESQKMEAIGTLAGGIAHDFNNIIAAILGNAELARQDAGLNTQVLESVEEIRKAASRARMLVQQILSFSRRQPSERKLITLKSVVDESVGLLRATLPPRIALDVGCDSSLPFVSADTTQMVQVLINLITNAAQAMGPDPGRIEIRVDAINANAMLAQGHTASLNKQAEWPSGAVRIVVQDDGPGIDAGILTHIFEPFFTTKPVGQGTGLGLSVAHGIVHSHEGVLLVRSQLGEGSTFTVYLPAVAGRTGASDPEPVRQALAVSMPTECNLHLLYIDDDKTLVSLITRLFEKNGIMVTGLSDQEEALRALRAYPAAFDLVLTDYNMPGMSGLDVAREVKAINPDLPVAIISGFIDEKLRSQAESLGVRELIFKADDVDVVCDAVLKAWQKLPSADR